MSSRSASCRTVRALLFEYCDRELPPKQVEVVDEHVVRCRACGDELSRVELERLRLKEILVPMEPSIGFTHSVMDRVRDVVAADGAEAPPNGFTSRVMAIVREEAGAPEIESRSRVKRWAAVAVAAVVVIAFGVALWGPRTSVEETRPDLRTTFVRGAVDVAANQSLRPPFEVQWQDGEVGFESVGRSRKTRWDLSVRGDSRLRFVGPGHVRLDRGDARLEIAGPWSGSLEKSEAPFRVDFVNGQHLDVMPGAYEIDVEPVEDEALLGVGQVRITVRVLNGSAVIESDGGAERRSIESGRLAFVEPLRPIEIASLPDPVGGAVTQRTPQTGGAADADLPQVVVRGLIQDPQQGPVPRARVRLHLPGEMREVRAKGDGSYEFRFGWPAAPMRAPFLSVESVDRADLAQVPFYPLEANLESGFTTLRENVELARRRPVSGRLLAADGKPVAGATVRAVRMDSFFGGSRLLRDSDTKTDGDGHFRLQGFTRGRRGEMTALLVEAAGQPPHAVYGLESMTLDRPIVVKLESTMRFELRARNALSQVVWVEHRPRGPLAKSWGRVERRELPPGQRTVALNVRPNSEIRWWEDQGKSVPVSGHACRVTTSSVAGVAQADEASVRDDLSVPLAGKESAPFASWMALAPTFGRFGPRPDADEDSASTAESTVVQLRFENGHSNAPVVRADVFVRIGEGEAWFAGRSDAYGRASIHVPASSEVRIIAMDPSPSSVVGELRFDAVPSRDERVVTMLPAARVRGVALVDGTRAASLVEYEMKGDAFQGYHGVAEVADDGVFVLPDVPRGEVRVRVGDRYYDADASQGDRGLPDLKGWMSDR